MPSRPPSSASVKNGAGDAEGTNDPAPTDGETKLSSRPASKTASRPASKTASRPASRLASQTETETAPVAVETEAGAKPPSRPASKTGSRPASKTGSRPASKTGSRAASRMSVQNGTVNGTDAIPEAAPEVGSRPASKTASRPASRLASAETRKTAPTTPLPDWLDLRRADNDAANHTLDYDASKDVPDAVFVRRGGALRFRTAASALEDKAASLWVTIGEGGGGSEGRKIVLEVEKEGEREEKERKKEEGEKENEEGEKKTEENKEEDKKEEEEGEKKDEEKEKEEKEEEKKVAKKPRWRLRRENDESEKSEWIDLLVDIPVDASVSKYLVAFEVWRRDPPEAAADAAAAANAAADAVAAASDSAADANAADAAADAAEAPAAPWRLLSRFATPLVVLFNPWNADDDVYIDDDAARDEFVLNDAGRVFTGVASRPRGRPWIFDQFDPISVDAALRILDRIEDREDRGDAVKVVRRVAESISVLLRSPPNDAVSQAASRDWNASSGILKEWAASQSPVETRRPWVFAALVVTLLRSLGIPARCVTKFDCGRDADESLVVERLVDGEGDSLLSTAPLDVFNEVWLRRRDLPEGLGGWQAVDAAPRAGGGVVGPTPVAAVKGLVEDASFDVKSFVAEVNSVVVDFKREEEKKDVLRVEDVPTRRRLSTKAMGRFNSSVDDISSTYHPPSTSLDSLFPQSAPRLLQLREQLESLPQDLRCSTKITPEFRATPGELVRLIVVISNDDSEAERLVDVDLIADVVDDAGRSLEVKALKTLRERGMDVKPSSSRTLELLVDGADYLGFFLGVEAFLRLGVFVRSSSGAGRPFVESVLLDLESLEVGVESVASESEAPSEEGVRRIRLSFSNPFSEDLLDCVFRLEGAGVTRVETAPEKLGAGEKLERVVEFRKPRKSGEDDVVEILASFVSDRICSEVRPLKVNGGVST